MQRLTEKEVNEIFERRAKTIAFNIKQLRKKHRASRIEVAFFAGISITRLTYAEKGINRNKKTYIPDLITLEKIAFVFGVPVHEIIMMK